MNTAKVKLNNGVLMPTEGFGVFHIPDAAQCLDVVGYAPDFVTFARLSEGTIEYQGISNICG